MLTDQHIAEALSRAYVQAIAARAGLNLAIREFDYGIDGSFNEVVIRNRRRVESGFCLHFQLKASTRWRYDDVAVVYDLEAKTYNDLVMRRGMRGAIPCLLILLTLPQDSARWLECSEIGVTIGGGCYWEYLSGTPTENRQSVRIYISRQQQFTPDALVSLLDKVKSGEWQT